MLEVDVLIEDDGWQSLDAEALCTRCAEAVMAENPEFMRDGVVAILLTTDGVVQALNRDFRGKDKATNVLSFPADEQGLPPGEAVPLGDIAIALGVTTTESGEKKISLDDHLAHLVVHGLLHLFGYDHIDDADAEEMEDLERRILARLGLADPYAE